MKKCIVVSDSFKGTLSSQEICRIARESFTTVFPACEVVSVPVADGGEGTVDCFFEACGGERQTVSVQGPLGESVDAAYLRLDKTRAVVEMAACAGLPLIGAQKDPCRAATYGVGQLIGDAVNRGCREIILGLGGSATNDGGCGCAAALDVRFLDESGTAFVPVGGTLSKIAAIDCSKAKERLRGVHFTVMCDIDNPLHGRSGAAYVFGPQKGADEKTVEFLDGQLKALDQAMVENLGRHVADVPGAGAAGGFGAGMLAFFDAEVRSGIETVLDTVGFDNLLNGADAVLTGEGRFDSQSLRGKVVSGVVRRARAKGVPVLVLAGSVTPEAEAFCAQRDSGIAACFSTARQTMDFETLKPHSGEFYRDTLLNVLRLWRTAER